MKNFYMKFKKYSLSWILAGTAFYGFVFTDKMPWIGLFICFIGAINVEYVVSLVKARYGKGRR